MLISKYIKMNHCTTDKCPQILDSSCVFYEGPTLLLSGINTNDSVEVVIQKLNLKLESIPGISLDGYYNKQQIKNIIKNYIPLSGTLLNYPVIGDIEFSPGNNTKLYSNDSSVMLDDGSVNINGNYIIISSINDNNNVLINNNQVFLNSGNFNNRKFINLSQESNYIVLQSNVDGAGLVGQNYYGNNYVDNSFVQKKFVVDTFNNIDLSNFYTKNETYSKIEVDDIIAEIPVVDISNLVPYDGANKDVNIGAYYFESSQGFKKTGGTSNQALTADGNVFDLTTKADLVDGKVPFSQLPSYVDDVLEFANLASFPTTGESGKIYIAIDTNVTYRWTGTGYAEISASLALGETSSTAYRGDRGKIAFDHSQTTGNPHNTTKADIGLSNVDNTSDLDKPVSILTQLALDNKVNKNPEIVSSTKTKITYDSKGLVIDGDDATTIDINDSIDRRYVTDVQLNTIQNTSGINTGDETTLSIQTKRPLKTINNESLEGSGNVQINYNDLDNLPTIVNDKNYVHNQIVASNFWEIQHNLDKYPSVSIIDSGNNLVVGEIKYIDSNNIIITFTSVFSGKAYLN